MSYLNQYINTPQQQKVQSFNSIESLLGAVIPNMKQNVPASEQKQLDDKKPTPSINEKAHIEAILQTPKEKLEIEKINEEIENDLKNAFLNEHIDIHDAITSQSSYKLYRDREETFECKISVEGTSLGNSSVRLILESDNLNLLFFGKIYRDGRCIVPLKKMNMLSEGTIGKAHLEVIIDDMIFIPWEETFRVEGAKKVTVEVAPQSKISVNMNTD